MRTHTHTRAFENEYKKLLPQHKATTYKYDNGLPTRGNVDAVPYEPFGLQSQEIRITVGTASRTGKIHVTKQQ